MKLFFLIFSIILAFALLLTVLLYVLRRCCAKMDRSVEHLHPSVFSFFTTIYAFFLGFAIVTLWSAFLTAQTNVAKTYGTFSIDAAGTWSYTLDDDNAAVQALRLRSTRSLRSRWFSSITRIFGITKMNVLAFIIRKKMAGVEAN